MPHERKAVSGAVIVAIMVVLVVGFLGVYELVGVGMASKTTGSVSRSTTTRSVSTSPTIGDGSTSEFDITNLKITPYQGGSSIYDYDVTFTLKNVWHSTTTALSVKLNGTAADYSLAAPGPRLGMVLQPGQDQDYYYYLDGTQVGQTYLVLITVSFQDGTYQDFQTTLTVAP